MGAKKETDSENIDFLSTALIAKRVSRSTETIRREIAAGRLKSKMFNGDYMIPKEEFEIWKAQYFKDLE